MTWIILAVLGLPVAFWLKKKKPTWSTFRCVVFGGLAAYIVVMLIVVVLGG